MVTLYLYCSGIKKLTSRCLLAAFTFRGATRRRFGGGPVGLVAGLVTAGTSVVDVVVVDAAGTTGSAVLGLLFPTLTLLLLSSAGSTETEVFFSL